MRKLIFLTIAIYLLSPGCANAGQKSKITKYYINSQTGNDANKVNSISTPWKSLRKLEEINFHPGDSILFAKNSVFHGGIIFKSSGSIENPIVISSYGDGALPSFSNSCQDEVNGNVFQVSGSFLVFDGLSFLKCASSISKNDKSILEIGAIFTQTGAHNITIKNCEFTDCPIGVNITGQHSLVTGNTFKDCNRFLSNPDWGPIGIVIGNAYNEISYNSCSNYVNIGGNYGADGGFIELDDRFFGAKVHDIKIHHNKSVGNMGFLEVEKKVEGEHIDVYYNLSDDYQQFIFYWGGNNSKIENNTVIRTKQSLNGAVNTVFTMRNGNFTLRNNIFVVANGIQVLATAPYDEGNYSHVIHENNLYFCTDGSTDDPCGKPLGAGELVANPCFVDITAGNFHLSPESPAINSGKNLGYSLDLDNVLLKKHTNPGMGAYQSKE